MINFATLQGLTIPEGAVTQISDASGKVLWSINYDYRYVSLGDSIAAGHSINADWADDYGEGSQYGKNGNLSTTIVPGCYTDLIRAELESRVGGRIKTTSFARSGDTVADLIAKLSHNVVINAIKKANMVTICIGANDILATAMDHLDEYITTGSLANIEASVEANLAILADDTNANSYNALFKRLNEINPNATYVFTTIYNPYKYLWIEEGHHGFFEPVLDMIPDMEWAGVDFDSFLKDSLLGAPIVEQLFDRVNGLGDWVEKYVTRLDTILKQKISAFQSTNSRFMVADTKAVYDGVPDRGITAEKHYNDLVSVEFTRDYDVWQMDWGLMYNGKTPYNYWMGLAAKHGLDINDIASEFVEDTVNYVITPNVDPHPESYGHYVLKRSFADVLGWQSLDRYTVIYQAGDYGSGTMATQTVLGVDGLPAYASIAANAYTSNKEGYYFSKWVDANDASRTFSPGDWVGFTGGLPLKAQWSNICAVRYRHSNNTGGLYDNDNTGPKECYELYINGELQRKLSSFADDDGEVYYLPYGTEIKVMVTYKDGGTGYTSHNGRIYWNGERIVSASTAYHTWNLTTNTDIKFEWVIAGSWVTLNAQSWWDCYITTAT